MNLIEQLATEKIIIIHEGVEQLVEKADVQRKTIFIPGSIFKDQNVYELKIKLGDKVIHTNLAGVTEEYIVDGVTYVSKDKFPGGAMPAHIQIKITNVNNTPKYTQQHINISGNIHNSGNMFAHIIYDNRYKDDITPDIKEKLNELEEAIQKKDRFKISSIFSFVLDKSVDLGIAMITGGLFK